MADTNETALSSFECGGADTAGLVTGGATGYVGAKIMGFFAKAAGIVPHPALKTILTSMVVGFEAAVGNAAGEEFQKNGCVIASADGSRKEQPAAIVASQAAALRPPGLG